MTSIYKKAEKSRKSYLYLKTSSLRLAKTRVKILTKITKLKQLLIITME